MTRRDVDTMLLTSSSRQTFVASCVALLRRVGFDGLVLHFEYDDEIRSAAKHRLSLLVQVCQIACVSARSLLCAGLRVVATIMLGNASSYEFPKSEYDCAAESNNPLSHSEGVGDSLPGRGLVCASGDQRENVVCVTCCAEVRGLSARAIRVGVSR